MNKNEQQQKMRETAARLLDAGEAAYVIGFGETRFPEKTSILFAHNAEEADRFVWNDACVQSLAKYLLEDRFADYRVGIFARGCESRAINRMIKDNQFKRDHVHILGIPCEGVNAKRCASCAVHNPVVYDELLWDAVPEPNPETARFARAEAVEAMGPEERYAYWSDVYSRCIRCYACRQACPVCSCRECYVDMDRQGFQGKRHSVSDNQTFGVTRAFHVADRCIECGECERVCPMGLPILGQTQKIIKDITQLSGDYQAGMNAEDGNFLGAFDLDDKDDFM
ncbi:MAG: 4Fe-4S dicluster domain-containing protein [Clostridiales bacterium]|nr:4Fe-4S dicluster domain-containing protein [Clostridiales bacterium]